MKLTSMVVITLLVLGCSAAFGQSLGFLAYDGVTQFCDYEVLNVDGPYAAGVHNLITSCGFPLNAVMVGVETSSLKASDGAPVSGTVFALADSAADAEYIGVSGCQIEFVTKLKPSTPSQIKAGGPLGWSYYFSCGGGGDYLGSYGFLTSQLGNEVAHTGAVQSSIGKAMEKARANSAVRK